MFKTDSDAVRQVYSSLPNYKIDYDDGCTENVCAVYFSSNDIYYPNTEEIFRKRIVEKDFFEWYHTRVRARKHIFVRDVFKQWYLEGINAAIDSPEKMAAWMEKETEGYEVVTVGSSAGGYAAVLYGSLLHAKRVIAFNAQFSLQGLAAAASADSNPFIFKYRNTERARFFDLKDKLVPGVEYFYFLSTGCDIDMAQYRRLITPPIPGISLSFLKFSTSHHGIPFLKVALGRVLNMDECQLSRLASSTHHPLWFTLRMVGWRKTVVGFVKQAYRAYRKRR